MKNRNYLRKKYGRHAWILVLIFILVPVFLVVYDQDFYNPLAQILFDIMLFGASLWYGISITNEETEEKIRRAEKKSADKWLSAAENSCREIRAVSVTLTRLGEYQRNIFSDIENTIPDIPQRKLKPLKHYIGDKCWGCSFSLVTIQSHIDNAFQSWSVFINDNCDEIQCKNFHDRLDQRKKEMEDEFDRLNQRGLPRT